MQDTLPIHIDPNPNNHSENCLAIGTMLAEFEIVGVIGEGGFGIVYLAYDHSLQRTVAIKEYVPLALAKRGTGKMIAMQASRHQAAFASGLQSFIKEARMLAKFDHPALIKVYRFWEENNTAYMAMQYYRGETLKNLIQNQPELVSEAWLKKMLKPLLEGLAALYRVNILHRDISPDNIMIQDNGEAVLLDFGAARKIINEMTSGVTVILKPGFAPVEQYVSDSSMLQGPWTDIYSLSAVVFFAIVKAPAPASVARMISDTIPPLECSVYPGYSEQFLAAIEQGMAVKPEDRPQSLEAFSEKLGLAFSPPVAVVNKSPAPTLVAGTELRHRQETPPISPVKEPSEADKLAVEKKRADEKKVSEEKAKQEQARRDKATREKTEREKAEREKAEREKLRLAKADRAKAQSATKKAPFNFAQAKQFFNQAQTEIKRHWTQTSSARKLSLVAGLAVVLAIVVSSVALRKIMGTRTVPIASTTDTAAATANNPPPVALTAKKDEVIPAPAVVPNSAASIKEATNPPTTANAPTIAPTIVPTILPTILPTGAEANPAADIPATGVLRLNIKPWANVFVDDADQGVSPPLKKLTLTEGKHKIKLVNPSFPVRTIEIDLSKKGRSINFDFSENAK